VEYQSRQPYLRQQGQGASDQVFGATGLLGTTFGAQPYKPGIDQITVQHLSGSAVIFEKTTDE
jgi:hypothetical protein